MDPLKLHLFGPVRASRAEGTDVTLPSKKAGALLAYVASRPERAHDRDGLARLFWPDLPFRSAQNNLRVTLARLKALADREPFLEVDSGTVRLARTGTLRSDVAEFERLLDATTNHQHERRADCTECRLRLLELDAIYRGPFLESLELPDCHAFESWRAEAGRRYRSAAVDVLHDLAWGYEGNDDLASAEFYVRRLLDFDAFHDGGNVILMRVLSNRGRRTEALRHFHRFAALLKAELGVEPDDNAIGLFHQLQTSTRPPRRAGGERRVVPASGSTSLPPVVGREEDLVHIERLLETRPIVTLHGMGGAGKTTLAREVARRSADTYTHGVVEIPLRTVREHAAVPTVVAHALGAAPPAGAEALDHLLDVVAPLNALLVLDGFEHVWEARAALSAIARRAPDIRILVTSRTQLGLQQETVVPVSGLDVPSSDVAHPTIETVTASSAGRLFIDAARRIRPQFDPMPDEAAHISAICQHVRGHPLALILAATWLDVSSCADVALELGRGIDVLSTSSEHVSDDHRSLATVFERSWLALSRDEQAVLAGMTIFRGGFDRAAARHVAGATLPHLGNLVRNALVMFDPTLGRYDLHDLVRHFASEKLAASGAEADVAARHAEYFLERLAAWDEAHHEGVRSEPAGAFEHNLDNLEAAWRTAMAADDLARLAPRVGKLRRLATDLGQEHVLIDFLEPLHHAAGASDLPADQEVEVLLALALAYRFTRGFMAPALAAVHARVVELADALGDSPELFAAFYGLWSYQGMVGELDAAEAVLEEWRQRLERIAPEHGDAFLEDAYVVLLDAEGATRVYRGAFAAACVSFEEAIARYQAGRHDALVQTYGMDPGVFCRAWLGLCTWLLGHTKAGFELCDSAIELATKQGHHYSTAFALQHGVIQAAWDGDQARCARLSDALQQHARAHELGFFSQEAEAYRTLARVEGGGSDHVAALAARLAAHAPNAYKAVLSAPILAVLSAAGAHRDVLSLADACLDLPFSTCAADLLRLRAEAHLATGAPAAAEASFHAAIETARNQGAAIYELRAVSAYGAWLAERGDTSAAVELGGSVLDRFETTLAPTEAQAPAALEEVRTLLELWEGRDPGRRGTHAPG